MRARKRLRANKTDQEAKGRSSAGALFLVVSKSEGRLGCAWVIRHLKRWIGRGCCRFLSTARVEAVAQATTPNELSGIARLSRGLAIHQKVAAASARET